MSSGFFITGTDTDAGKTWVCLGLLKLLHDNNKITTVMKPVSAGCLMTNEGLRNQDAELLINAATIKPAYNKVNPYAFEAAIAPHIAAKQSNIDINITDIKLCFSNLKSQSDYIIVEGAGGWLTPINDKLSMADIAKELGLPIIIVVGMKLGCLNHALLTVKHILDMKLPVAGWVANSLQQNFTAINDNIDSLKTQLTIPFLGTIPYLAECNPEEIASHINKEKLLHYSV